ncbi:pleckstrin homology domain-containing family A member 6 isoform X1 [Hemicordylus capensis]|uniref:pleckstrin homology domain-containing family A member 6 isoform X1 n=2 Tax=Hemicordylus capensis TaxID=884348 RepID=UPI0023030BE2|nr:pleckstrin homology domain-containing family A member 6 isoform X1 [Hemicordylus capensis]XP_053102344.1 pleckstrin homology domain-containing family A member 6 isoform X1 [Hemicordylus capensis]XP_053102345.1 pleckstrin homology domain-containing family A member 6 isoform X1 [Hemicordylus capensis]XP_053102346.1 pleckstrin homology domain-containing family A member 6 isoform X1 [Hemicordylus capensis]XP_053102347.1 pleckstrin homology domain-containing family A member 6 isoform X1 [Hemicord
MSSKAGNKRPAAVTSGESSNHTMVSEVPQERPNGRASRSSRKGIAFGKRSNSMKRNPNAAVTKSGWLFKQASSGVKQWNKRWFVLVDRCLFYYKDEKEDSILGSIPLLSFRVAAVQPSDNISRKYTFKVTVCWIEETAGNNKKSLSPQAEHAGIRTYFFSAENNEEQESWIQAMGEAARVQIPPAQRHEKTDSENIPPSKNHQHLHHRSIPTREPVKAEPEAKTRGEGDGRGSERIERKPERERAESKKEPLVKANGIVSQEMPSEPGSPYPEASRVPAGVERPSQPNGWQYSSPSRPGSMAYPQHDGETAVPRRSFAPRTNPEKIAQRKSSMTQLQQWVNLRRGAPAPEDLHSPTRFYPMSQRVPDYYPPYSPQYSEDYQYYPPGVRPDSICSMPAYERVSPQWTVEDKRHSFRNSGSYQLHEWKEQPGYGRQDVPVWLPGPARQPVYYDEMDAASGSLRRMSLQPRSRSVPRSPSQGSYNRARVYSPVRSPSARFERMPPRSEEIYAEPTTYMMRRSVSSPKYDYLGDRRPVPAGMFPFNYPASPTVHDKMDELLDLQLQRNLEYLDQQMSESETLISMVNRMVESSSPRAQLYMQVSHFPEAYRETLHTYKLSEQDTDKLLGKLCEQNKVMREQERLVQQLRAEKESLESALMGTHQELEMFGSQPAYPEKLLHKKESLQNQLINIRVELSQASTALANSTIEYENLEGEVSALHDDLWEQLNLDIQNEMLNRQIQKEIWRIQDVMEGLRKNNPSRGTDTAKHRVTLGPSGTYSSNSPASPLSSASLTSPLSPFSLVSGSQSSPTKQGSNEEPGPPRPPLPKSYVPLESPPTVPPLPTESRLWPYPSSPSWQQSSEAKRGQSKSSFEQSKKDHHRISASNPTVEAGLLQMRQEQDADKQVALNKVGIVPPRTKSPMDEDTTPISGVVRRSASNLANGLNSRDRPKSAVFSNEMKAKMSVEEQIDRMKRHQSGSMKEKRRSLQLPANQQQADSPLSKAPASYKVVRRHRSIHEVDISDLEAALRSEDSGKMYETPREEIARLRKMELEPEHYDVDISKELSTPDKVLIPERYIELEPDTPLSPEEMKEKQKKVERIKTLIAKSSMQNVVPLNEGEVDMPQDSETQLQEQEKRIEISCALAAEASRRGRMLSAQCATPSPPTSPASPTPPTKSLSSDSSQGADSHFMRV